MNEQISRTEQQPPPSTTPIRVAFDARYIRDSFGGIARYARCLLAGLADLPNEVALHVYFDPAAPNSRFPLEDLAHKPSVNLHQVRLPLYSPEEQLAWPLLLRRDSIEIFYSPYFALPLLAGTPLVCTVHDLLFEHEPAYRAGRWVQLYYRPMMWLGLRRAAGVFVVSETTRQGLLSFYGTARQRKVTVVSEAAARSFRWPLASPHLADVRHRLALPDAFVLTLGARRPHKNLGAAVRAFHAVQDEVPHTLVVVGRSEARYADDVTAAVAELGGGVRLLQIPAVAEADLPAVYALADAFVIPSLYEGFGLPALEAMACGTPVVAASRGSLPEVVGDGGLLIDVEDITALANALRQVLQSERLRADLRLRGLARAKQFSWEQSAHQAVAAFRQLVRAGGR
ncbi:MAG: glycosyltransferase family 4 protein [Chloroflexota bacterium]